MGKLVVGLARFLPLCTLLQALPAIAASRPAPFLFLSTYRARIVGRSLLRAPTLILVLFSVIGLTAYGGGGNRFGSTASAQTGPTPTIVTLSVNPKSIIAGQSATISWYATNATTPISSCTASGDWSGLKPTSSSQPEPVTPNKPGTTTYTLTCTGPGGTGSQSVNLTTQTTINANSTITVLATEGWQEIPFFLGNPVQFTITYVPGQRGWTVDKRNFSYVGLAGYTPDEDRQIFQGCKINSSWPNGAHLGKKSEGE